MRSKIVAGNWKMNKNRDETKKLLEELAAKLPDTAAEVMVAPAFVNLEGAVGDLQDFGIEVIAQNMHFEQSGAYTGEVSASMLLNIGESTVNLGQSERRAIFGVTDELLHKKVKAAISAGVRVVFCFGEELAVR
jgi:triosephosphate isomerase